MFLVYLSMSNMTLYSHRPFLIHTMKQEKINSNFSFKLNIHEKNETKKIINNDERSLFRIEAYIISAHPVSSYEKFSFKTNDTQLLQAGNEVWVVDTSTGFSLENLLPTVKSFIVSFIVNLCCESRKLKHFVYTYFFKLYGL